jgi:hypothetical protein
MSDKDWVYLCGAGLTLAVLWFFATGRNQGAGGLTGLQLTANPSEISGAFPINWSAPMTGVYNANPQAYSPPTNADLTLNIADQSASMLNSAYMPLFGFVGVAQQASYN